MLDVDHFKTFNDRSATRPATASWRRVAGVLRGACRDHDSAARYGGEEFAVIVPGADPDAAAAVGGACGRRSRPAARPR